MTLWLANLAAYSVQLAVLVGTAVFFMTVLRVSSPAASLRFWQVLFAASLSSPLGQLWIARDSSHEPLAAGSLWRVAAWEGEASSALTMLDGGLATLLMGTLAAGAVIRVGWLALGLIRLRAIRAAAQRADALEPLASSLKRELGVAAGPSTDPSIALPKVVHEVKPEYTPEAMQAKVQGSIFMSVVVLESGEVGDVTVTQSLDKEHGLDQQAVDAARQWKFDPGTKDGKPVPVEVEIEMTFTLK